VAAESGCEAKGEAQGLAPSKPSPQVRGHLQRDNSDAIAVTRRGLCPSGVAATETPRARAKAQKQKVKAFTAGCRMNP